MMKSPLKTITIIVKGKVQGVYFRQSTKNVAAQLQITGTVANLDDGSVSIDATGTMDQLQQLIDWTHKGPEGAKVDQVKVTDVPLKEFDGFRIVRY